MSRKSVPFTVPDGATPPEGAGGRPRAPDTIDARSDEWVSDRNSGAGDSRPGPGLVLDLAAERSLAEVVMLGMIAPFALGCFWLMNAMSGRVRF